MPVNVTFRSQLLGGVSDFSQSTNIPIFAQTINLVELIVLLARYQEEGQKLAPKVYITNDILSLCSMLPDNELIKIGSCSADVSGIKLVLKKCAPLASGGWMIFIQNNNSKINYGLFKGSSNPIAVLVDDVTMTKNDDLIVVKVFQIAENCVEVKSNNGGQHYIFLDHRQEESLPPLHYLDRLVEAITSNTKEKYYESIKSFLTRLLFESLRESHGCIIAVTNMSRVPKLLTIDSVILDEPIDFGLLVENLMNKKIEQSYISSKGHLLRGMLNSDGILIFDNRARLLGYNCFIKVSKKAEVIGGARRRAFNTLTNNLGRGLCGVFMQSQDGWSDFEERK
ncbi:hypothetical protein GWP85_01490 [Acinetobacter beijerinckii]|uniref:hypothetical protein n=1 Tax=Acinetobacter beijerinckii TaxID=262668 RepID=UPI0023DDC580|nr:hypothetical protein [Acinetobacter beijerinckii]MDF2416183.1 hypothetical protein [Acinetobacter beijerinckii]